MNISVRLRLSQNNTMMKTAWIFQGLILSTLYGDFVCSPQVKKDAVIVKEVFAQMQEPLKITAMVCWNLGNFDV